MGLLAYIIYVLIMSHTIHSIFTCNNEISIPELNPIVDDYSDCFIHIASDYTVSEILKIRFPISISNLSDHNLINNIPTRYLQPYQTCRLVIIVSHAGRQQFNKYFDRIFLDKYNPTNESQALLFSPTFMLLLYINFTIQMNNQILFGIKS